MHGLMQRVLQKFGINERSFSFSFSKEKRKKKEKKRKEEISGY
jgi:hypothetical protein